MPPTDVFTFGRVKVKWATTVATTSEECGRQNELGAGQRPRCDPSCLRSLRPPVRPDLNVTQALACKLRADELVHRLVVLLSLIDPLPGAPSVGPPLREHALLERLGRVGVRPI